MFQAIADYLHLTPYGAGSVLVLVLYAIVSEVRFGKRARSHRAGRADRGSTVAVAIASAAPILGFLLVSKCRPPAVLPAAVVRLLAPESLPWLPPGAWCGVGIGFPGVLLRLWAVLTLRHRYTRTLLIQDEHAVERNGPYRFVRHPGYLLSILCLNGIAVGSGSVAVSLASFLVTTAVYHYRVGVEDRMLVERLGAGYEVYRREVPALWPLPGRRRDA